MVSIDSETTNIYTALTIAIIVGLILHLPITPASAEMEKLDKSSMQDITAKEGLGIRLNLRLGVGSSWDNFNDDSSVSDNDLEIKDGDGRGSGNTAWLAFHEIFGTITPVNANDNTLFADASPDVIQFTAPNPFTGINLTIDDISTPTSSGSERTAELGSVTLGDNDPDGDNDYLDGKASFDFHNTKLKIF